MTVVCKISHYELSWYLDDDIQSVGEKVGKIGNELREIRKTVSDAPRKYIDNTLDVICENYR